MKILSKKSNIDRECNNNVKSSFFISVMTMRTRSANMHSTLQTQNFASDKDLPTTEVV